jgi:phosphoribosylanthranilate isomerase
MLVKVCGLTNVDDARLALEAGADYLGFVLYERSPRSVTREKLAGITAALGSEARCIGVFVNEEASTVNSIVRECGLYAAQIHGDESPGSFCASPFRVWRAVRIQDRAAFPPPDSWAADRYVVDAAVPGLYGGTGAKADWEVAAILSDIYPVMLAGGLTPSNVADAITAVRPTGVDVASGVESEPGIKDPAKVRTFIEEAKSP